MWPRWLRAVGCGLALAPAGCFWPQRPPTVCEIGEVAHDPSPTDGVERVVFDTRLLEQPVADPYLRNRLWTQATDPLPHQLSAVLAANGLRVGLLTGATPAEFDELSAGEGTAVAPTLRRGRAGQPKPIPVNGPLDHGTAAVTDALTADRRKLTVAAAECAVVATGTPQPDGRLAVRCQWLVRHGDKRAFWSATHDGGFDRVDDRTREEFPTLTFEVSLAAGEVLVVGPTSEPDDTLGGIFFLTPEQSKRRVLVIRAKAER